eukprot:jgi/Bigna1/125588/aug1.1_g296
MCRLAKPPKLSVCVEMIAVSIFLGENNPFDEGTEKDVPAIIGSITVQVLMMFMILLTSTRLVQKANSNEVSPSFLIQSFLSTAILFAGIYFTLMLINKDLALLLDISAEHNGPSADDVYDLAHVDSTGAKGELERGARAAADDAVVLA